MYSEIISQLELALDETLKLLSTFTEKEINTIPFEGSWTAAQVGRHLYKSQKGMDGLLLCPADPVKRDPEEKANGLRDTFLNFDIKMKSPDFIIPEEKEYDKDDLIASLKDVKEEMIAAAQKADLTQLAPLPEGHPLEGHSKLEIVHFVTYHTIRHNHQLEEIRAAL